jgi:aspartate carbamoyltransferase regulatory subunit
MELPTELIDVLKCNNPRCITSVEQELPQRFKLTDPVKRIYRCIYCEQEADI